MASVLSSPKYREVTGVRYIFLDDQSLKMCLIAVGPTLPGLSSAGRVRPVGYFGRLFTLRISRDYFLKKIRAREHTSVPFECVHGFESFVRNHHLIEGYY